MSTKKNRTGIPEERSSVRSASSSNRTSSSYSSSASSGYTGSSSSAGGSTRSITSSVAYEQLKQLDSVLQKERQAREEAEKTLMQLHSERASKDKDSSRKTHHTEQQLSTILSSLEKVLENPGDMKKLRKLQKIALEGRTASDETSSSNASTRSSCRSSSSTTSSCSTCTGSSCTSCSTCSSYTEDESAASSRSGGGSKRSSRSSSSSSKNKRRGGEGKKAALTNTNVCAVAAAGGVGGSGSSTTNKFGQTFFDKFGSGDARQRAFLDRAMNQTNFSQKPAGAKNINVPSKLPTMKTATKEEGTNMKSTFNRPRTDLMSEF